MRAWWRTTAADRFTKIGARVLDHRKFWQAMHAVTQAQLAEVELRLAVRMVEAFDLDIRALALDMTNFASYIDSGNDKAPIAQRGKAKQKRSDLRLVGLGLVVTRDGGVPLLAHAYPGDRPDVTQFAKMIDLLVARHAALAAAAGAARTGPPARSEITVVFHAGQNSQANFAHLATTGLGYVGSVPPSDCPDLLALPATDRRPVEGDSDRFDGLTALETRRSVYGSDRRVVLTHSPTLHEGQSHGLARGKTRRPHAKVTAEIEQIIKDPWAKRVLTWELTAPPRPSTASPSASTRPPAPAWRTRCSANGS